MGGKIDPYSGSGFGSSWKDDPKLREALARMAQESPDDPSLAAFRPKRMTLPEMDLSGPSRPVDLGNPDEPGSEAFALRQARQMPAATPDALPDFATWQADQTARDATEARMGLEMARADRDLSRAAQTDALFRQGHAANAARQAPETPGMLELPLRAIGGAVASGARKVGGALMDLASLNPIGGRAEPAPATPPQQTPAPAPAPPAPAARQAAPGAMPRPQRRGAPVQVGMAAPTPSPQPFESIATARPQVDEATSRIAVASDTATPPEATPQPSDLDRAMEAARGNRLIAGLTRAGGTAIGRGTGPGLDALDENANAPLAELGLRRGEEDRQKQQALAAADADPNSPQSQAARMILGQMVGPEAAQRFGNLSYAQMVKGPLGEFLSKAPDVMEARIRASGRGRGGGGLTPYQMLMQADREDRRMEGDIQKASKDYEEVAGWEDAVKTLEEAIAKGDPEGVGRISGRLSNWGIGSDEGLRNRQAMATLGNAVLRSRAGQAVTPSEAERVAIETGMQPGATEEQFDLGARATIAVLRRAGTSRRAKYRDPVNAEIERRGGFVPPRAGTAPAGGSRPPPSPGMVRIRDPKTGRTGWAKPNAVPPGAEVISGA